MARKQNKSRRNLEEKHGLSTAQVNKRLKEGTMTEDFAAAKHRKEVATADLRERQAEKADLELELLKGSVVTKEQVRKDGARIGAIFSAALNAFRNNAPGKLAGLDEVGVRKELDSECDQLMDAILAEVKKI